MKVFDFIKKLFGAKPANESETKKEKVEQYIARTNKELKEYADRNHAHAFSTVVGVLNIDKIRDCFIAFDVETTGLSKINDRIVEIGAVIFHNGKPEDYFHSLVNTGVPISSSAFAVNHITDTMIAEAPTEEEVYSKLVDFLGEAMSGKIIMCAHNADFDFAFLTRALDRLGYGDARIEYADTLEISRKYLKGLENYKQSTVAEYLGIVNEEAHRAASDAECCGHILCRLLDEVEISWEKEQQKRERLKPTQQEMEACAYIQKIIDDRGGKPEVLRYEKNAGGYINICCRVKTEGCSATFSRSDFLRMKLGQKKNYVIVKEEDVPAICVTEPSTQKEKDVRVLFSSPFDLEPLSDYIYKEYVACYENLVEYSEDLIFDESYSDDYSLTDEQVISLLETADKTNKCLQSWKEGEAARKAGDHERAIELFDNARQNGYISTDLYDSYAIICRQKKDYSKEIEILDEGILKMPENRERWEARKEKAVQLLSARQEKIAAEKAEQTALRNVAQTAPQSKAVIQMDDDGNIIAEFESISAAERKIGVNSKSIRAAANGQQKHAGGFCWMFKNEN